MSPWIHFIQVRFIFEFILLYQFLTRALADAEMKTNISETEVFVLPNGQEIEKENIFFKGFIFYTLYVTVLLVLQ